MNQAATLHSNTAAANACPTKAEQALLSSRGLQIHLHGLLSHGLLAQDVGNIAEGLNAVQGRMPPLTAPCLYPHWLPAQDLWQAQRPASPTAAAQPHMSMPSS